jgi:rRNA-processing protein FCF1
MEVILDTNFILTCVKQKIDFFSKGEEVIDGSVEWLVPFEVLQELEDISKREGEKTVDKESAKIGLEMTKLIGAKIINVKNKNVDQGIIDYAKDKDVIIATLDKEIKKKSGKSILVIRGLKSLEVI